MPERDDELDLLRVADPLDPATLPSATDPAARALFERIVMTDPSRSTSTPWPLRLAVAAAVLVLLVAGAVALLGGADDDPSDVATGSTAGTSGEPISPGGLSGASCVEVYDLQTLARRELAFDGTVVSTDGDQVTFTVQRWFRGGDGAEVTLGGAAALGGTTSAGAEVGLAPGTRLLVAGDGGFAWSCGFTQPYDPAVAQQWADAFG